MRKSEMKPITPTQLRIIRQASQRPPEYYVCPTKGLTIVSQMSVLAALLRRGYITADSVPVLTRSGLDAAKQLT